MMMRSTTTLPVLFVCLLVCAGTASAQWGLVLSEDEAIKTYYEFVKRKPFLYHVQARSYLATARTAKTLAVLIKGYDNPPGFAGVNPGSVGGARFVVLKKKLLTKAAVQDFARYDTAWLLGRSFGNMTWETELAALRKRHAKPENAWLWVQTFGIKGADDGAAAMTFLEGCKDPTLKAAGMSGMARRGQLVVLGIVPSVCKQIAALKKKPGVQRLLIGALSNVILANKGRLKGDAMQQATRAYIGLLGADVKLALSEKLVIARHLSRTIGKDRLYVNPEPWIKLLDQGFEPPKRAGNTVTKPRFFGVEADGDRICYVVDMSNSMLKPIDPKWIPKGPITGPKKKRRRRRGKLPTEEDIPWHLIKTRFDVAREHLKISLLRLPKGKRFCIVWFGSDSGMFKSTPGMIKVSKGSVRKCIKELDSIKPGPLPYGKSKADAPYGWLRGDTNMHSGIRRAFQLHSRGFTERHEHVDLKCMAEGCDAIFLLSDGAPSVDDFWTWDKDYKDGKVVADLESRRETKRPPMLYHHGPMDLPSYLRQDVQRLNIFRKVQIHCISIGDADIGLMDKLAEEHQGESFTFGRNTK